MQIFQIDKAENSLETQIIGRNMVYFKEISSTNTYASSLARTASEIALDLPGKTSINGTVIIAETQTGGRGRFERRWVSPGGGLWFTIILQPQADLRDFSNVTILTAAVILEALLYEEKYIDKTLAGSFFIKWPNDIYFKNKKLAGILCESEKFNGILNLFIGIGININFVTKKYMPGSINAISLFEILNKKICRESLFADIINSFEKNYNHFLSTGDLKSIFSKLNPRII